ncbi:hypothetical protein B0H19DRAFT_164559 [Mycena capillaripes]|nr:hypothetical protein B0H19DRAFT_164559 [Mycena capillaripes]
MGIPLSVGKMTPRNLWAALQQSCLCGKPTWSENDMPDLSGQVVIVTGGNSGLGKETFRALLQHNAKVYMACRSREKAEIVITELRALTGKEALFLEMDLARLSSIKAASDEFLSKETKLNILYNNAGIMVPPIDLLTSDGPSLIAAAALHPTTGRVVNLTSVIHYIAIPNYNSFKDGPVRRRMHPSDLYSQSKWANAVFSAELARRYGDQGIISVAVNPGNLRTNLSKDASGLEYLGTKMLMIWPVEWGVLGQLWAGTSAEGAMLNSKYVAPWGKIRSPREDVNDLINGTELWTWLEEQVAGL